MTRRIDQRRLDFSLTAEDDGETGRGLYGSNGVDPRLAVDARCKTGQRPRSALVGFGADQELVGRRAQRRNAADWLGRLHFDPRLCGEARSIEDEPLGAVRFARRPDPNAVAREGAQFDRNFAYDVRENATALLHGAADQSLRRASDLARPAYDCPGALAGLLVRPDST